MKAPKLKGGGPIKGDPNKPVKSTIDRSKYQSILSKPLQGGDNVVGDSQGALNPEILKGMGYDYVGGTLGGKDIVYRKGNNHFIYNEKPNDPSGNKYGLVQIGDPYAQTSAKPTAAPVSTNTSPTPQIDPNRKPLNLSNPNLITDPNKIDPNGNPAYYNNVTGAQIKPIVQQYKAGGSIKSYNQELSKKDFDFQNWYNKNTLEGKKGIPYSDNLDYDYYSFFKNNGTGNIKDHFPDTFKRPNHKTFSQESIYSIPENKGGKWENDVFKQYKAGGLVRKLKGYANGNYVDEPPYSVPQQNLATSSLGPTIQPTGGTNYQSAIANANQQNAAQNQNNAGNKVRNNRGLQLAGAGAMAIGNSMYQEPGVDSQTQQINSGIDNTAASLTPWYGLAKGASDIAKSQLKKDQYGYTTQGASRTADEWLTPFHKNAVDEAKSGNIGGAIRDITGTGTFLRGISKGLSQDEKTSGFWGKFNNLTGISKQNASKQQNIDAQQQAERDQQAAIEAEHQRFTQGRINETMAHRDAGDTDYKDQYFQSPPPQEVAQMNARKAELQRLREGTGGGDSGKSYKAKDYVRDAWRGLGKAFAMGGLVEGPGTGKSDSIKAKVKPGSFVVPVENVPVAKEIKKALGKPPKAKANLNQINGTEVKLSDGEMLFNPGEVREIKATGINIDRLAPRAQYATTEGGFKNGGPTAAKAHEMLKDGTAHGHPLTQKQKAYFGYLQSKEDGGIVGYAGGGDVEARKKAAAIKEKQDNYKYLQNRINNRTATPQERVAYQRLNTELGSPKSTSTGKRAPKVTAPSTNANGLTADQISKLTPSLGNDVVEGQRPLVVPGGKQGVALNSNPNFNYSFDPTSSNNSTPSQDPAITGKKGDGFNWGQALDYGIPLVQAGLGLKYLKNAGKRPVDQLDPDYLRSIDTARGNVVTANANAKFGFSPEEQAQLDMQNNNLTNAGRYDARNFSGGSSANAFGLERAMLNDSYGRSLGNKVQNRNLIFQKQQIANDRQQYLDSLVTNKVGMSNRLFNMKLDAWQQNQNTGAGLLASAAQNAIGAHQWNQELQASKERNAMYNPQPVSST